MFRQSTVRYAEAKFSMSGVWDEDPEARIMYHYFRRYPNFLSNTVGQVEGSSHAENELDSFSRFDLSDL